MDWANHMEAQAPVGSGAWDGQLMHIARRGPEGHGWWSKCEKGSKTMQLVGNATPTCLWCIAGRLYGR